MSTLFPLILHKMIGQIEIILFITVCCDLPFLILIQIREMGIRLILMVNLGHMHHITIR